MQYCYLLYILERVNAKGHMDFDGIHGFKVSKWLAFSDGMLGGLCGDDMGH